ncbi:MAG: hypothetical protein HY300_18645 [Verrucomicrobia bacterium]|nr:hypothetical protein [Verrucomicrobiota bacterium]
MNRNTISEERRATPVLLLALAVVLLSAGHSFAQGKKKKMETQPPPGKPVITRVEPRGVQRGLAATIKLIGTNLAGITNVSFAIIA